MSCGRERLHARPEDRVGPEIPRAFREDVARRAAREPLQYITGVQEFWSLPFVVSSAVMIPRPETEMVVEACLARSATSAARIVDIGTGAGCIAVSVAREIPGALVHATDISEAALAVARLNAARNDVAGRIAFYRGDLFEPLENLGLERQVDFVLSNPPYIPEDDLSTLEPEVRDHEPRTALTPGPDALSVQRRIAAAAPRFLKPGAYVIIEFGLGQAAALREIYDRTAGMQVEEIRPDLAGIERVLVARSAAASA